MASQEIKQRIQDQQQPTMSGLGSSKITTTNNNNRNKRAKKIAMARKGLRSLAMAVGVPFMLTIFTIYFFQLSRGYTGLVKSFWYPPVWIIHLASLSSACLMGLSAWLVWAEGAFHRSAAPLPLFVTQFALGLLWGPVVFTMDAVGLGLVVCMLMVAVLYGCCLGFRKVNPIAADLVKPCIAWAVFLTIMNYKLLYP